MPAKAKPKIESIIFSPPEVAERAVTLVKRLQGDNAGGLTTGIPELDAVMIPMRGSQLITVLGYTSWYKSGLMNFIINHNIPKMQGNQVIAKFTWEQSVEEDTLSWLSADSSLSITQMARGKVSETEWKILMTSYTRRATTPLWIVGHSTASSPAGQVRPRMTMDEVVAACQLIERGATEEDHDLRLIVLDYLQRIPPRSQDGTDKRLQMAAAVDTAKDLSIYFDCPVLLGCQTGRQVLDRKFKLPRPDDGQETSNIEQSSDAMLGVWYPIKSEKPGLKIGDYEVTPNLLLVGLLKQKLGPAPSTHYLYVDPAHNKITGLAHEGDEPEDNVYRG